MAFFKSRKKIREINIDWRVFSFSLLFLFAKNKKLFFIPIENTDSLSNQKKELLFFSPCVLRQGSEHGHKTGAVYLGLTMHTP